MSNNHPHTGKLYQIPSQDGSIIPVWSIIPNNPSNKTSSRPVIIHLHGGAFIAGGFGTAFDPSRFTLRQLPPDFLHRTHACLLSVQYRWATNHPYPAALDDAYATVLWAREHAGELGIDVSRMYVLGISAGGGLGVSLVAKARDEGLDPPVCGVMAIYPMVDPGSQRRLEGGDVTAEMAFINQGWDAYLRGHDELSSEDGKYAVPLEQRFEGFPKMYVDVGTRDLFHGEVQQLEMKLCDADVVVEVRYWDGMVHNFEASTAEDDMQTVDEARNARMTWLEGPS